MNALEFAHATYGELVKQFGLNTTHTFGSWDQLPQSERDKWIGALAVMHKKVLPHGEPKPRLSAL
jgi:hypothetical protein